MTRCPRSAWTPCQIATNARQLRTPAQTLVGAGRSPRRDPTDSSARPSRSSRCGPTSAAGDTVSATRCRRSPRSSTSSARSRYAELSRRANALASSLRTASARATRRDHVPQSPLLHRRRRRGSKLGANALSSTRRSGAAARRRASSARTRRRSSTTRSSPSSCGGDATSVRFVAWPDGARMRPATRARGADRRRTAALPAGRAGPRRRSSPRARPARRRAPAREPLARRTGRRAARRIPLAPADDDDRRAAVPLLGFAHFTLGIPLGSTLVIAAASSPRARSPPSRATGDARSSWSRDAPAHPRAGRRGPRPPRPLVAAARRRLAARRCPASSPMRWMDRFGDVLYNLYGSTEVAWATIATPEDLRAAPGTAGRPPRGVVVKLSTTTGAAGRAGRDRPHLRRQRAAVRGLHRRRRQGARSTA